MYEMVRKTIKRRNTTNNVQNVEEQMLFTWVAKCNPSGESTFLLFEGYFGRWNAVVLFGMPHAT